MKHAVAAATGPTERAASTGRESWNPAAATPERLCVTSSSKGSPEAGERFFAGKGNCLRCHAVKGNGARLGPDPSNLGGRRRVDQILKALNNAAALRTPGYRFVNLKLTSPCENP